MELTDSKKSLVERRDFIISKVANIRHEILELRPKINERAISISVKCDRAKKFSDEFDEVENKLFQVNAACKGKEKKIDIDEARDSMDSLMDEILEVGYEATKITNTNTNTNTNINIPSNNDLNRVVNTYNLQSAHLRPIELPKFDGNNFNHFWGVFTALVDDTNLTDVVKFHHLCSALNEEGTSVISEYLPISAPNYPLAKQALLTAYKNERKQATQLMLNMLNFSPLANSHKTTDIAQLVNKFSNSINGLMQMKIPKLDEFLLFMMMYSKLDNKLRFAYEQHTGSSKDIPTHGGLIEFLQKRIQTGELSEMVSMTANAKVKTPGAPPPANKSNHSYAASKPKGSFLAAKSQSVTSYCCPCPKNSDNHRLYKCPAFKKMEIGQRWEFVQKNKLCPKCLNDHDFVCSFLNCRHCNSEHNSLLCKVKASAQPPNPTSSGESPRHEENLTAMSAATVSSSSVNYAESQTQELLATAVVIVKDELGQDVKLRALIDSGSQSNFITDRAAQLLNCRRSNDKTQITGISGASMQSKGKVEINIRSHSASSNVIGLQALVLNKICGSQPARNVAENSIAESRNLQLADPKWGTSRPIDLLLGVGVYTQIISSDQPILSLSRDLKAQFTSLGYIVFGTAKIASLIATNEELTQLVERMWELDQMPNAEKAQDPDDVIAENFYVSTTKRDEKGRYIVKLPFKNENTQLMKNKYPPMQAFLKTEKRLQNNPNDAVLYQQYFQDYLNEEKMVPAEEPSKYLLIHHPVKKQASSTSKVRPVFNASAPDKFGRTLNSSLLKGPNLVADIYDVLFSFRLEKIAFVCDVKQMYNSVLVDESDWKWQHILWRPHLADEVREYALTRVTFGMAPSSFLAQRTIRQLIEDEGDSFPLASLALRRQLYVDDVAACFANIELAIQAKNELITLMERGGFLLRKFASSHPEMLQDVPESFREPIEFNDSDADLKILGLAWCPMKDTFFFKVQNFNDPVINKRTILSYSARIFDVKGLLTPVIVLIRAFIKHLWEIKCNWDDPLSSDLQEKWLCMVENMPNISSYQINRFIPVLYCKSAEIVGFCDGSSVAHAAVIYLRCVFDDHAEMYLIKAKGKVNPMKPQMSIPRVELQGAKLLVDLYLSILPRIQDLPISKTTFLTDSKVVLAWLHIPPYRLQLFVSNRVAHIVENTNVNDWRYVPSAENSADPASRGLLPEQLMQNDLWWKGPAFLRKINPEWSPPPEEMEEEIPEMKKVVATNLLSSVNDNIETEIISRFSSLERLNRVMAWIMRFKCNSLAKMKGKSKVCGPLTTTELTQAHLLCVRQVQKMNYNDSIFVGKIPKNLRGLTPFVDHNDTIRIGGRLDKAPLPYESRHPILIPKDSRLAVLICNNAHRTTLHGGPLVMRASIQQRYWIVGISHTVKKCIFDCRRCYILRAKPPEPMMAELPASRFEMRRAFINVSCDFAGPFNVHEGPRPRAKILKAYVCVFTCMSTRATHLEVVEDLSTAAYLAAVDRMVARRGLCQLMMCDNGTNFKGASVELKAACKALASQGRDLVDQFSHRQIKFQFICPVSPWKNGITERVVGLFKTHLTRVIGVSILTYTEFTTLVTQIEAVLNSRPLIPLSVNCHDGVILTPGHFLTGDALLAVPSPDLANTNHLSRWQTVKLALQSFWRQWRTQYLQTLMERAKWRENTANNFEINQVVYMKQENVPPLQWPMGIIDEICPHNDGTVRVVKVRTSHGVYQRPVNKLIPIMR